MPIGTGTGNVPYMGQFPQASSRGPSSRSNLNLSSGISTVAPGGFDTKLVYGATSTREQFKGIPNTGFTPQVIGAGLPGSGGEGQPVVMFQQRLRLMFIQLVQQGMSHKDAAKHIQSTYGIHARTGQRLEKKLRFTKEKHVTYAGHYPTAKHYHTRSGHHRPRSSGLSGTPAGLK